ncbi:MAG: hypothetical protein EOP51_00120 [Sphingobacteriales bacterium]|nr:MAG: hypothetical protein EOP51_00120 [Sphingobacteriales bacterium]
MTTEHGQSAFIDAANGLELVIVTHDVEIMKFYSDTLTNYELAQAAFKENVDYWLDGDGVDIKTTRADTTSNYIIWGLDHPEEKNVILYGVKNGRMVGLDLMKNNEWDMNLGRARTLLQRIFNSK